MPVGLIHLIPDVSTGLILVAFVCALIAWIAFKKMRARERLLRTMLRSERFKALQATISHFEVNTANLSTRQQFSLAAAQIRLRRVENCRKTFLGSLCALLLSLVIIYAIDRSTPAVTQAIRAEPDRAFSPRPALDGRGTDQLVTDDASRRPVKVPFDVRLIKPTLDDELVSDGQVTVADLRNPIPNKVPRDGEFFLIPTRETDRTTIHVLASPENVRVERTLVLSGYTLTQVPCDRRTIHLAKRSFEINEMTFAIAMKILSDTTRCESIDKALVIWDSFQQAAGSFLSNPFLQTFKNAKALIEYHWARGNYQACVVLELSSNVRSGKPPSEVQ